MRSTSVSFLGTSTGLAIHVAFFVSRMNCASSNRLTSSPIALRLGSEKRLRACFTGFVFGLMCNACSANSRGIPGMSAGHQANISHSSRRKAMRSVACSSGRWAYTRTVFVRVCRVHLVSDCVAVDAQVAFVFLGFASVHKWEGALVRHHGYFSEFLFGSECVGY